MYRFELVVRQSRGQQYVLIGCVDVIEEIPHLPADLFRGHRDECCRIECVAPVAHQYLYLAIAARRFVLPADALQQYPVQVQKEILVDSVAFDVGRVVQRVPVVQHLHVVQKFTGVLLLDPLRPVDVLHGRTGAFDGG